MLLSNQRQNYVFIFNLKSKFQKKIDTRNKNFNFIVKIAL